MDHQRLTGDSRGSRVFFSLFSAPSATSCSNSERVSGWGGIRTPGTVSRTPVFKTGALNHSATQPAWPRLSRDADSSLGETRPRAWIHCYALPAIRPAAKGQREVERLEICAAALGRAAKLRKHRAPSDFERGWTNSARLSSCAANGNDLHSPRGSHSAVQKPRFLRARSPRNCFISRMNRVERRAKTGEFPSIFARFVRGRSAGPTVDS